MYNMDIKTKEPHKFTKLFDMDIHEFINPKNQLLSNVKQQLCITQISDEILNYPNYKNLKSDLELLKIVCNLIENMIKTKSENICNYFYEASC
mgnify:CR=1 FL=1